MLRFCDTRSAGRRAEESVKSILRQYTKFIFTNCKVDTLFTQQGVTEIDITAAIGDVILIVEVKNIRSIEGAVNKQFWVLEGAETGERYSSLNILTQNRIHVRSFKDAWFAKNKKFPIVISVVVVPNSCWVPSDIKAEGILTISEFEAQVAQLVTVNERPRYGYALHYFYGKDDAHVVRPDFR